MEGLLKRGRLADPPILAMCCLTRSSINRARGQALLVPARLSPATFARANFPAAFSHGRKRDIVRRLRASAGEAVPSTATEVSSGVEGSLKSLKDAVVAVRLPLACSAVA